MYQENGMYQDTASEEVMRRAAYVYAILCGDYDRRSLPPEAERIEDLYAKGAPVDQLYGEMMAAYDRLSQRLHPGEEEDEDVEVFFTNALAMCEYIGLKMYRYGDYYARHPDQFPQKGA